MSDSKLNEFDAAKQIAETLAKVDAEKRLQVIRWAAESAGVAEIPPATPATKGAADLLNQTSSTSPKADSAPDIKTFINNKNPRNDVQFATTVAYYYSFAVSANDKKETIGQNDVQDATRLTGRPRYKNPAIPLDNAAKLGYLNRVGSGQFKINAVGENLVAMTLPGNGSPVSSQPTRKKTHGAKTK